MFVSVIQNVCRFTACLLALWGGQPNSFCQVSDLIFHHVNQSNGLSELNNAAIFNDSRGFIWLGSLDGLNRFDGRSAKVYRPILNGRKIEPNITGSIFEDEQGNVWFSTNEGIHCIHWQQDSLSTLPFAETGTRHLWHLDSKSNLWVQAGSKVFRYHTAQSQSELIGEFAGNYATAFENPAGEVMYLAGSFWAQQPGLEMLRRQADGRFSTSRFFFANDPNGLPNANIYFLYVENDSTLWLPSTLGLIRFNPDRPKQFQVFQYPGLPAGSPYVAVTPWRKDSLWIASSSKGIFLFDKKHLRFVRRDTVAYAGERAIDLRRVNNLFVDKSENLWISIWEQGVFHASLRGRKFQHLLSPDTYFPPRSRAVSSIMEDHERQLWCCVPEEGIFVFDKSTKLTKRLNPFRDVFSSGFGSRPQRIDADRQGNLWFLSESGVIVWEKTSRKFLPIGRDFPIQVIQLENDALLLATYAGFKPIRKTGSKYQIGKFKISPPEGVYSTYWDAIDERLYVSDGNLLLVYEDVSSDKPHLVHQIRGAGYVNGYDKEKGESVLWLATSKGLGKLDTKNFTLDFVNDKKSILNRALNDVRFDLAGMLWLSSNSGIIQFDPSNNQAALFTLSDGLQGLQFMLGAGAKLSDGRICFGGVNGGNIFNPQRINPNPVPPAVHIANLIINNSDTIKGVNPITLTGKTFKHYQNTITFQFIAIEYGAPLENSFKYRLVPYDRDTVYSALDGIARYPNLPKGNYILQVFAANSDDVWSLVPKTFELEILPHWMDTWQFKLASGLVILILLYLLIRFRIAQIREKADLKTRSAENKMAALRAQMDPHFIFNSLNTVNAFIMRQDLKGAVEYVSQFSKLMRKTLEHSRVGSISLEQEIELLEIYMKIEARRFKTPFEYAITTGKDVDTFSLEIPSMLLQPFVENAIKHGLFHRQEQPGGRINIAFLQENGTLKCVVEDNGVGRAKAAELNAQQGRSHVSRGLQIVAERLQLLKMSTPENDAIKTIDLFDLQGNATGTRVEILLPLDKVNPA